MTAQKFRGLGSGSLAIEPKALSLEFGSGHQKAEYDLHGSVACVTIRGPLMHHCDPFWDSYDAIVDRVRCALDSTAPVVLLAIDSPGGLVAGCLDAAREIRSMARKAGKTLVAYVDEQATSAAYAVACSADAIYVPQTGVVGSIGVIETLTDVSAQLASMGVQVTAITSGARKADGNPQIPLTDEARVAIQAHVDTLAGAFFGLVSEMRNELAPDLLAQFQAACFNGVDAVNAGLADGVLSLGDLYAQLNSGGLQIAPRGNAEMAKPKMKDMYSALAELAESEDEAEAKKAKRMLRALAEDDKEEPAAAAEEEEAPPSSKPEPPPAEEASAEAPAAAAPAAADDAEAAKAMAVALQKANSRIAALEAAAAATARAEFMATRPDLSADLVKALAAEPNLDKVKAIVAAIPKPKTPAVAALAVTGTLGEGQANVDGGASKLPPAQSHALKVAMGMVEPKIVNRMVGSTHQLGVVTYDVDPEAAAQVPGIPQLVPGKAV